MCIRDSISSLLDCDFEELWSFIAFDPTNQTSQIHLAAKQDNDKVSDVSLDKDGSQLVEIGRCQSDVDSTLAAAEAKSPCFDNCGHCLRTTGTRGSFGTRARVARCARSCSPKLPSESRIEACHEFVLADLVNAPCVHNLRSCDLAPPSDGVCYETVAEDELRHCDWITEAETPWIGRSFVWPRNAPGDPRSHGTIIAIKILPSYDDDALFLVRFDRPLVSAC